MTTLQIILGSAILVIAVVLMILVMIQQGKNEGLGAMGGSTPDTDSFFGRNKNRTKDALLSKLTIVCSVIMVILVVVLGIIS